MVHKKNIYIFIFLPISVSFLLQSIWTENHTSMTFFVNQTTQVALFICFCVQPLNSRPAKMVWCRNIISVLLIKLHYMFSYFWWVWIHHCSILYCIWLWCKEVQKHKIKYICVACVSYHVHSFLEDMLFYFKFLVLFICILLM